MSIICTFNNEVSSTSCRSTDIQNNGGITKQTFVQYMALEEYQLVQDLFGEDIEYKFQLIIGNTEYIAWRRFSEFRSFIISTHEIFDQK
jgi:hypothetical protein